MSLKYNGRAVFVSPSSFTGQYKNQRGNTLRGDNRNRFTSLDPKFGGYNNGALAPGSLIIPQKSGSISSYTSNQSSISGVINLTPAKPMIASDSMTISVTNAQLDQIVQFIANATASIAGVAGLAAAVTLEANGNLNITVTDSTLGGIFPAEASGSGSILPNCVMTAKAFIEANGGGATPLSPEGLAQQLLDTEMIETGYSMRESLKLILSSLAGKVSGAGSSTITIRDINDTIDRIVATVDSNGNRTNVTKDVS